jgi:hypothetical protein
LSLARWSLIKGSDLALAISEAASDQQTAIILVDDFAPQPLQGDQFWYYNRLGGDRGQVDGCDACTKPGGGYLSWGRGAVTATITQTSGSEAWVGVFTSLNHPIAENIPLNFSAIFPSQILTDYQGHISGMRIIIRDGYGVSFQAELQSPDSSPLWSESRSLSGGQQTLQFTFPTTLKNIRNLNWIVKGGAGDYVVVDRVELTATLP